MPDSQLELAVLDMAGTTVNENGCVERAVHAAIASVGAPAADPAAVHAMRGLSKRDVFRRLLPDEHQAAAAHSEFVAHLLRAISDGELEACAGARETLVSLRGIGVKVCLITGFEVEIRDALIEMLGWQHLVDLSVSPNAEVRGRPHPDLVFAAMMRLEASAVQSVLVAGDTINDLLAGYRAGAGTLVGVLGGAHSRAELAAMPHTHLVEGIGDLGSIIVR